MALMGPKPPSRQDIDECKLPRQDIRCISGECINTIGSFYCGCPLGSYGGPSVRGGCVKNSSSSTTADELLAPSAEDIGLAGRNTSCGKVQVPYPFGLGPVHCYLPGFNLTCDTSHDPPRLVLEDDGSFQVVDISLIDSTARVIRTLNFANKLLAQDGAADGFSFYTVLDYLPSFGEPYSLSPRNELVLNGCGLQATLHGGGGGGLNCSCSNVYAAGGPGWPVGEDYCSGTNACCHAPIFASSTPINVTFQVLNKSDLVPLDPTYNRTEREILFHAFLTEGSSSSMDQNRHMNLYREDNAAFRQMASPFVLQWAVKQGFFPADPPAGNKMTCSGDVAPRICKSDHSDCRQEHGGYTCQCSQGYQGNPYITGGCKDIDECIIPRIRDACFGECNNLPGSYLCRCPRGTHGNPSFPNGCRPSFTGLSISVGVGSGAGFILLVVMVIYVIKKLKHRRSMILKQNFFKQNRGQLLQQLLGGGGHGTVYKGILSDLHVVAIKKSKIAVQRQIEREIDEFINKVAILSQISHRNVVKLYGCCLEIEVPLLVYEFVSNGTLHSHLHVEGAMSSLSWNDRLRIATETAKAIAYLHSATSIPIIHRDIKSTNILLDDTLTSKVSDFGASRHIPVDQTGVTTDVQGTIGYLDPSYYYTGRLTEKSDIYSFGVLLVELLTRKKPYSHVSSDGIGLVAHFVTLYTSGSLVNILDHQVTQEAGSQNVTEVATLAVTCENDWRRATNHETSGVDTRSHSSKGADFRQCRETFEENIIRKRLPSDPEGRSIQGMTRRYSLEKEFLLSARYPR
ncbi:LOW QUALITY PROTEIN: hypothetical protein U9M48_005563 [Paspalum notatum var. saurae]|uniref:Protein kinase domain-containing protein n=1 Tax=Paspalum notatum var. saurae TaxID=547442 RepID=A0AAQ3SFJ7_PASNO